MTNPMRTERFYFAVVDAHRRFMPHTVRWWAKASRKAATDYLPTNVPLTWASCLKMGMRVVKITVQEFVP